jgi:hypothetical protein
MSFSLPDKNLRGDRRREALEVFAESLREVDSQIGFKISARGWCYELEGQAVVTKGQFDLVERLINDCRKTGILPIDFTAEEEGRQFSGVEKPESESPTEYLYGYLKAVLDCGDWYVPDWWNGEECYIQMVVEKIDLKTMFEPICQEYHIPIATSKGWSSILMRGEYARRFKEAEDRGLKCVLLYCGDHDPDGLRISDFLRSNLEDVSEIVWEDGEDGYEPADLEIERFGLNYDFIRDNRLTWIEGLETGSGRNLASPSHPNHRKPYVQEYLRTFGPRKCEANAILKNKEAGRKLCRDAIEKYLGPGAKDRFRKKRQEILEQMDAIRKDSGLEEAVKDAMELIE